MSKGGEYYKRINTIDRVVRAIFAVEVAILYCSSSISGTEAVILGVLGVIMLLTIITTNCELYWPLGIATIQKDK